MEGTTLVGVGARRTRGRVGGGRGDGRECRGQRREGGGTSASPSSLAAFSSASFSRRSALDVGDVVGRQKLEEAAAAVHGPCNLAVHGHPKDVGRVADEEEGGLVPENLLVEGEEKRKKKRRVTERM